jgi:hypothetical protein
MPYLTDVPEVYEHHLQSFKEKGSLDGGIPAGDEEEDRDD